jgi:site-specific DNA recombinase
MTTLRAVVYGRESQGKAKSVDDQVQLGAAVAAEHGWEHAGSYDDGTSASRYGTRTRPGWEALTAALSGGQADVLILWESTRGTRQLSETAALLDACRDRGALVHVISDERTYDPRRSRDYADLARAGVDAGYETDRLSERVQRGLALAAKAGRPAHGKCPYGYRRVYDPNTGELAGQELDPDTAPVVARIYAEVVESVPLAAIAARLVADGIAPPPRRRKAGPPAWTRHRVRDLARLPAYAGYRVHRRQGRNGNGNGEFYPGDWPPIVSPETWHAAQRVLDDPSRSTVRRPGRTVHLLSMLATCHRGHPLMVKRGTRYACQHGCASCLKGDLDRLVEAAVVEALADPKVYRRLRQAGEASDADAKAARDEIATLRARLSEWRQAARRGEVTPASFADIEAGITADITAAKARRDRAALPPAVRPFLTPGADIEARWDAATVQAKRDVIRALCTVTLHGAGRGNRTADLAARVVIDPAAATR